MASQEPWHPSAQDSAQGPPQSLPPPPHRPSFGSQQSGHPVLPPPAALGAGGNRNQGYYTSLPSISGLGASTPQHGSFNLPSMSGTPSPQLNHANQSPSVAPNQLPSLSSSVVQGQKLTSGSPPSTAASLAPPPLGQPQGQQSQQQQQQQPGQHPLGGGPGLGLGPSSASAASQIAAASYRPLNVKDALSYLDQVKVQFQNQPDVYNRFLDIMKDFKSQSIDTPGVIDRVSTLFSGHPNLIQGFNTFLPPGYRIECSLDPSDPNPIRVTTPMGTTTRPDGQVPVYDQRGGWPPEPYPYQAEPHAQSGNSMSQLQAVANGSRQTAAQQAEQKRVGGPVEFNHAISYVNKIKNRFASQPDIYKNFLEILQTYQREQKPIADVYAQVTMLFKDAPDLLDDFKQFLPEAAHQRTGNSPEPVAAYPASTRLPPVGHFAPPTVPKEKKKRTSSAVEQSGIAPGQAMQQMELPAVSGMRGTGGKKMKLTPKPDGTAHALSPTLTPMIPEPLPPPIKAGPTAEELAFFDRVKKYIGNKQTYNEFLKLLNLFSQDIIDKNLLVEKAEAFIGGNKDLIEWFKKCVGYDNGPLSIENVAFKKHQLELSLCKSYGPSYRLLPKSETHQPCSGRDEMCWEVLNDEWVSHPTWASEDSGFVAHRKNQFEEVLHRIEEERHEYDHNVEGNLRTIQILEPIANRISNMSAEEKASFRLAPGLGHSSKSIYQRIIKKVYDRERGQEVIDALHENPAVAVPIVLKRLKQKDEEWKRAQREWNKVWRETEARVFYKSLDHQGLAFKQADKKTLTTKFLVSEIDTVKKEQTNKRLNPLTPTPKSQLNYNFDSLDVIHDVLHLLSVHLEHSTTFSSNDREKMDGFLKTFIPLFFGFTYQDGSEDVGESQANSETEELAENGSPTPSTVTNGKRAKSARDSDLLRDVLKKSKNNRKREKDSQSREATPDVSDETPKPETAPADDGPQLPEAVEKAGEIWIAHVAKKGEPQIGETPTSDGRRVKYNLFANTTIYCFFRLFQVLYSRLEEVKKLEAEVAHDIANRKPVQFAKELGIISSKIQDMGLAFQPENCYGQLLEMCEKLIEGDLEHQWFEESLRQAYRNRAFKVYTVDKVVQAIAKHAHTIISDTKCSEIVLLYDRDRHMPKTTNRDQIIYRLQVEAILGTDENIFRMEYNEKIKGMAIQMITHEDLTLNDAISAEEKWKYYLTSYIMSAPTEGVPADRVRMPFLRRNLPSEDADEEAEDEEGENGDAVTNANQTHSKGALRVRLCQKTYRLFFEELSEDFFVRHNLKPYKKSSAKIDQLPESTETENENETES
ncbi:hypothetical protein BZA70DRAFT_281422 [Myxozyma melibiosi]|uniref:Histone deacetylase interacting domain-containing protein n=1 Tax=Myxozyma melibiosi TaxID=54550 RepID=A0ABR1F2Q4_9ASCO